MKYCQLTKDERYLISQLRKARHSVAAIARILGRHRSTIYRDKNGSDKNGSRFTFSSGRDHPGATAPARGADLRCDAALVLVDPNDKRF